MIPQYNLKTITFLLFTIYISLSDLITLSKVDKNHRYSVIELIWSKKSRNKMEKSASSFNLAKIRYN